MQYCKCISEMQWAVYLGHIDIMYATVVIPWYLPDTQKFRLSKVHHLYGYLKKYTSTFINLNTEIPAYENCNMIQGNWGNFYDR